MDKHIRFLVRDCLFLFERGIEVNSVISYVENNISYRILTKNEYRQLIKDIYFSIFRNINNSKHLVYHMFRESILDEITIYLREQKLNNLLND